MNEAMKCSGRLKRIAIAVVTSLLVFAATVAWLLAMPGTSHCPGEGAVDVEQYKAHAVKVVVKPWLGQHHVFGIFIVPLRYRSGRSYFGTISVPGINGEIAPDWQPQDQRVEDVVAEPGYYLIRGYIPTRIALWFLFTGQFGDLRIPCNWTLEFVRRAAAREVDPREDFMDRAKSVSSARAISTCGQTTQGILHWVCLS